MTDAPPLLLTADAVIPMTRREDARLQRGGVAVRGNVIVGVGTVGELRKLFPDAVEQHTAGVMLPGLVNAHTHLELGYQRAPTERPAYFTDWITSLMRNYPPPERLAQAVRGAVRDGIAESLRAGVTTVGDISRHSALTRAMLVQSHLRAVSFGEVIGLGKMRQRRTEYLQAAASTEFRTARVTPGLSPHAPYTVEGPTLREAVDYAVAEKLPLTMHLAELAEEEAFLRDHSGRLAEWPLMQNLLDAAVPCCAGGPLAWAAQWGLLGENGAARTMPVVLAHVNYATDEDIALLAASRASVVYCPRTRAYFGHDEVTAHPYRRMIAAGINVCLGTDSLASNPDLSVLAEASFLHRRDRLNPYEAFAMITARAGRALGLPAGMLVPGTPADIIVCPAFADTTLDGTLARLLESPVGPTSVWVDGVNVVPGGR